MRSLMMTGMGTLVCAGAIGAEPLQQATPPSSITVPAGFEVELLRSAQAGEDSWISMTFDPRGRIIIGLDTVGLARLEPPAGGDGSWSFVRLDETLKHCRGVLYAHDSLYVNATDSHGFYRLRDADGDGQFDDKRLLKSFDYRSRYGHGPNQIALGPDGMLYLVIGNDVSFPEGTSPASPYRDPRFDRLLPDPRDAGQDDRVGYIVRTDPEGKEWTVLAGGFRNQVDVAFHPDGEMFTWDADMEWDVGLPWYRPTRLNHVVSGGEYGWRWGTSKWPTYYQDSLPSTLDTGLGSPTGMVFGTGSAFPARYRQALFMADWQHGRILAVTLTPRGATYDAEDALFAEGGPLNVCDLAFGPDGALYFITGGRGSQSGLYRVAFTGPDEPTADPTEADPARQAASEAARALRHRLEEFHVRSDPASIDFLWPHLGSEDRWIRNAARVALERQEPTGWQSKVMHEDDPVRRATAGLALVRVSKPEECPKRLEELLRPTFAEDEIALLTTLRACSIAFSRGIQLSPELTDRLTGRVAGLYPHPAQSVNRELCELLVVLNWPQLVAKTLTLIEAAASQEEKIFYAHALLRFKGAWSIEERKSFIRVLRTVKRASGGHLFPTVVAQMEEDFLTSLSDDERTALAAAIEELRQPLSAAETVPSRPFVRRWTLEELLPHLHKATLDRDVESGRQALAAASCLKCHRMHHSGSAIGPDLTHVGRRFDLRAIAESILDPSNVIDPKYHATTWVLASGRVITGRAAQVTGQQIVVEVNASTGETVAVARDDVEASQPSDVSPMPNGLLDTLTQDEILDLLAYLRSAGEQDGPSPAATGGEQSGR
ncbi:MAG: PQQ-dependent sugar dehydrogenase [Planctomycetaceae bacterium]